MQPGHPPAVGSRRREEAETSVAGANWFSDACDHCSKVLRAGFLRNGFQAITAVVFALLLGGCAGYRLGPTNGLQAGEKTIQINPFQNLTMEPRLGDAVTMQMRKTIQRDGTYRLATHGEPDIVLTGTITQFSRRELSLLPNDVLTARDYRLNAAVHVIGRETSTDRIVFDRVVTGYTLVRVGSDLTSAERQALPLLAEDLARNATALLVDGAW